MKTQLSFVSEDWRYRDLALIFTGSGRFEPAIAACEKSAQLNAHNGAYGFRDLCTKACEVNDYKTALECQKLSKQYYADAGNQSMSILIISQTEDSNFLEHSEALVQSSVDLIDEDREFGLQALISVAKKFADLQMFEDAMTYTELASTLKVARGCKRDRDTSNDVYPFIEMSQYMLSLKQYKLAEEYARKVNPCFCSSPNWLFSNIIAKQMQEENFVNEALFSEINNVTEAWRRTCEALVFGLIDNGRYDEAQKFAKSRLQTAPNYGKDDFKRKLERKLLQLEKALFSNCAQEALRSWFTSFSLRLLA